MRANRRQWPVRLLCPRAPGWSCRVLARSPVESGGRTPLAPPGTRICSVVRSAAAAGEAAAAAVARVSAGRGSCHETVVRRDLEAAVIETLEIPSLDLSCWQFDLLSLIGLRDPQRRNASGVKNRSAMLAEPRNK